MLGVLLRFFATQDLHGFKVILHANAEDGTRFFIHQHLTIRENVVAERKSEYSELHTTTFD